MSLEWELERLRAEAEAEIEWWLSRLPKRDEVVEVAPYDGELSFGVVWIDGEEPQLVYLDWGLDVVGDVALDHLSVDELVRLASALERLAKGR